MRERPIGQIGTIPNLPHGHKASRTKFHAEILAKIAFSIISIHLVKAALSSQRSLHLAILTHTALITGLENLGFVAGRIYLIDEDGHSVRLAAQKGLAEGGIYGG